MQNVQIKYELDLLLDKWSRKLFFLIVLITYPLMLSLDFRLKLKHVGLINQMISVEYIKGLFTECDFRGSHWKEFFILPLRLVKHQLHLCVLDGLQLIQAVNHYLPFRLHLLLPSRRLIDTLLWQSTAGTPSWLGDRLSRYGVGASSVCVGIHH